MRRSFQQRARQANITFAGRSYPEYALLADVPVETSASKSKASVYIDRTAIVTCFPMNADSVAYRPHMPTGTVPAKRVARLAAVADRSRASARDPHRRTALEQPLSRSPPRRTAIA